MSRISAVCLELKELVFLLILLKLFYAGLSLITVPVLCKDKDLPVVTCMRAPRGSRHIDYLLLISALHRGR